MDLQKILNSNSCLATRIQPDENGKISRSANECCDLSKAEQLVTVREGDYVFNVGEAPRGLYQLKSGAIKLVTHRPLTRGRTHNSEFINKIVSPGEFFGFKALIKGDQYPFFAKAIKNSEVQIFSKEAVTALMNSTNCLLKSVLIQASRDLETNEVTSQMHYLASVQERIAYQLALLAEKFGVVVDGGLQLSLKLTRNELAQLAGTINESLSRHLTELKNEGIIDVRGREIIVKNLPLLKEKSGNFNLITQKLN